MPRPAPLESSREEQSENLGIALDFLNRFDEFEPGQVKQQTVYHLNRWMDSARLDQPWEPDPLCERMPRALRLNTDILDRLGEKQFDTQDVEFLLESLACREIADWVSQQPLDPLSAAFLKETEIEETQKEKLKTALLLFDWTVRNIRLDPLLELPEGPAAGTDTSGDTAANLAPPLKGIPGPGYRLMPWQVLLYGHGDAWQRARVFILLCRQAGLNAVMLGIDENPRPRPWLPAVLLGNDLYLFEAELALPIPGSQGKGIATLARVQADPAILRQCDVAEHAYSISAEDAKKTVALLDADPASLSRRIALLEQSLSGRHKMALAVSPSKLARQLREATKVQNIMLWSTPLEAPYFRRAFEKRTRQDPRLMQLRYQEEIIFEGLHPLLQGRHQHYRGQFENDDNSTGAKEYYMQVRVPQQMIDRITTSPEVQQELALVRGEHEREQLWNARLKQSQDWYQWSKQHATYWLGLVHYETQRPDVARNWFATRVMEDDQSPWQAAARYNAARSFELEGQFIEAQKLLAADESPQLAGNLLRIELLQQHAASFAELEDAERD